MKKVELNMSIFLLLIMSYLVCCVSLFIKLTTLNENLEECETKFDKYKHQIEEGCFVDCGWNCE